MSSRKKLIELFSGGGGASLGIKKALGRSVDIAVNHDEWAIEMHRINNPDTAHYIENVYDVDPLDVLGDDEEIALLWLSPDCTHFSKAKRGCPVRKKNRSLAWVLMRWLEARKPDLIILENVEEFKDWGPVGNDGKPKMDGVIFRMYVEMIKKYGYSVDWKVLSAKDYGAPTTRSRLFLVARSDCKEVVWPEKTHGQGLEPYVPAISALDLSIPTYDILMSDKRAKELGLKRPLTEKTMRRIARGIQNYIVDGNPPIIDGTTFLSTSPNIKLPVVKVDEPAYILSDSGKHGSLIAVHILQHNGGNIGGSAMNPVSTITTTGSQHQIIAAAQKDDELCKTLRKYGLKKCHVDSANGGKIQMVGMRMLTPRELFNAQGFPRDYKIYFSLNGVRASKTRLAGLCGNSVVPIVAEKIVYANREAIK